LQWYGITDHRQAVSGTVVRTKLSLPSLARLKSQSSSWK
jgi:hypothetical protein